jgi:hypothetical protein
MVVTTSCCEDRGWAMARCAGIWWVWRQGQRGTDIGMQGQPGARRSPPSEEAAAEQAEAERQASEQHAREFRGVVADQRRRADEEQATRDAAILDQAETQREADQETGGEG